MKNIPNSLAWVGGVAFAFGSWCMQQPQTFTWADITKPINLGSLIVALFGVYVTGKGVTQKEEK